MRTLGSVTVVVLLTISAAASYGQSVLATFDIGASELSAVETNGCATVDPTAGKHGGALKIACQKGQTFFVKPRNRSVGFPGNLAYNLRIESPPVSANVTFVYYALMGLTGEVTPDRRVRFVQFDPYDGTLMGEVLSAPLDGAYHTVVMLQSATNRLFIDGAEVGNLPGLASHPVADLATIGSHGCDANDCAQLGVQDAVILDLDGLVAREDETVPSGPISGGVMRPSACSTCTWNGAASRCPGCDTTVCKFCRGMCCQTQAAHAGGAPLPPRDSKSQIVSRGPEALETFAHSSVVPSGQPVIATLLQARVRKTSIFADPALVVQVGGLSFLTPCVVPPLRWSACNRLAGGAGRMDLVNPATGVPWTTMDLDAASVGVQHTSTRGGDSVTWISWEVIYEE